MEEDLKNALKVLKSGGVILYPTDTIWGLGCDATNEEAVRRIFQIKQREDSKSMLVLTDNEAKIERLVEKAPDVAWDLINLSETPLTIIYSGARNLAKNLIAHDGSIGIRVTKEEFSRKLCERFRSPIVSTSANVSGQPSPQHFDEISDEIKNAVDYTVSYRQKDKTTATPSSIIKLEPNGVVTIIRK
ncbi:MAG: threonylcarbamoyl-AMP synthase [Prevotellaceae bacterium]|jgi:L-threonylcarbamoyladenylate synthase|nr:threonylcarbamoyl-AMP synthase [Prevotellaceae bacterium]